MLVMNMSLVSHAIGLAETKTVFSNHEHALACKFFGRKTDDLWPGLVDETTGELQALIEEIQFHLHRPKKILWRTLI